MLRILAKIVKKLITILIILLIASMCTLLFIVFYSMGGIWGLGVLALVFLFIVACAWADWYLGKGGDNVEDNG